MFGWGQRSIYDEGETLNTVCRGCGNQVWLRLHTSKTWVTIFLIPILPYKLTNWLECPTCSRALELRGLEMLARARRLRALSKALIEGGMSEEQYLLEATKLESLEKTALPEKPRPPGALAAPSPTSGTAPLQVMEPAYPSEQPWKKRVLVAIATLGALMIWMIIDAL